VNAIPDKFAQWDAAAVRGLLRSTGNSRSIWPVPHLSVGCLRTCCGPSELPATLTSPTGRWEGKHPVGCRGR
jgi:hypothetical protein